MLESNAGKAANFSDKDYSEQGAQIVFDTKKVYEADIIIKIAPPTLAEIEMMKPGQICADRVRSNESDGTWP